MSLLIWLKVLVKVSLLCISHEPFFRNHLSFGKGLL